MNARNRYRPGLLALLAAAAIVLGAGLTAWSARLAAGAGAPPAPAQSGELGGRLVATWPLTRPVRFEPMDLALSLDDRLYVADAAGVLLFTADGRLRQRKRVRCGNSLVPVAVEVDGARQQLHGRWDSAGRSRGVDERGTTARDGCRASLDLNLSNLSTTQGLGPALLADLAVRASDGSVVQSIWAGGSFRIGDVALPPPWSRVAMLADGTRVVARAAGQALELFTPTGKLIRSIPLPGLEPLAPALAPDGLLFVLVRPVAPDPGAPVVVAINPATGGEVARWSAAVAGPHPPATGWPWALAVNLHEVAFTTATSHFQIARLNRDGSARPPLLGGRVRTEPLPRADYSTSARRDLRLAAPGDGLVRVLDTAGDEVSTLGPSGERRLGQAPLGGVDLATAPDGTLFLADTATGAVRAVAPDGARDLWRKPLALDAAARIAADGARVYVARPGAGAVEVLAADSGAQQATWTAPAGALLWPTDLAAVGDGSLAILHQAPPTLAFLDAGGIETARLGVGLTGVPAQLAAAMVAGRPRAAVLTGQGWVELYDPELGLLGRWLPVDAAGAPLSATDVAMDADGRVYVADGRQGAVLVYEPAPDLPTPVPSATPTGQPTPDGSRCRVRGDKVAAPARLVLGETARVTLTLRADCPGQPRLLGADVLLVVDQSSSMVDGKLDAAVADAANLAGQLYARGYRVGLVTFNEAAVLASPLDAAPPAALSPLTGLAPDGLTDIATALRAAGAELLARGRAEALPVVILLSDGYRTAGAELESVAGNALRAQGAVVFALGYGREAQYSALQQVAGSPGQVTVSPRPVDLDGLVRKLARLVADSLASDWLIEDEMAPDIAHVPRSSWPAAVLQGDRLSWVYTVLPRDGVTLTYRVRPDRAGRLPTNRYARARFVDADGSSGEYVFPVPEIEVLAPTATPTPTATATDPPSPTPTATPTPGPVHLPLVQREECLRAYLHVVLIVDSSSSMGEAMGPGGETKIEAARRAVRAFLEALRQERDSASIVRFDATAGLVAEGRDRTALLAALAGLRLTPGTRIDRGLAEARAAVGRGLARPGGQAVAVLLSDGAPDAGTGPAALAEAAALTNRGVPLYTVGVGEDADLAFLQRLANSPGRSFRVRTGDELVNLYRSLAASLSPCARRGS